MQYFTDQIAPDNISTSGEYVKLWQGVLRALLTESTVNPQEAYKNALWVKSSVSCSHDYECRCLPVMDAMEVCQFAGIDYEAVRNKFVQIDQDFAKDKRIIQREIF